MKRKVRIIIIDDAKAAYGRLKDKKQLKKSIEKKINLVRSDPFYGDNIPKRLIPGYYNVQNLWRAELSSYHRLLYTIRGDDTEIICFIVDILDHKRYDKRFGYRKK